VKQAFGPPEEHDKKAAVIQAEEHERVRREEEEGPAEVHDSSQHGKPHGVDLTGQVWILPAPGERHPWSIGVDAFTDTFKGKYGRMMAPRAVDARPMYVAVKIFRASTVDNPERTAGVSRRLVRESKVWLRLNHPNIQPYLGHCSGLGLSVTLISPLCGNAVLKYISINPSANTLGLVQEVAIGLKYLHSQNVIHCDLQCNNVLVNDEGHAVLCDFSRAKVIGEGDYSDTILAGSAAYMAPELFPNDVNVNMDDQFWKKSDVYAFGMLCYEIFINEVPFACYNARMEWQIVPLIQQGKRPRYITQVQRQIPMDMWRLMEACWAEAPKNRPSAELIVQRMR